MTQRDLNRAIARATGESIGEIEHMGFSEIVMPNDIGDASDTGSRTEPAVLDWDALEAQLASDDPDGEPPLLAVA